MADIGKTEKTIVIEPLDVPQETPAPEREKEEAPA